MLNQKLLIVFLVFFSLLAAQEKKSLFFDEDWKVLDSTEPRTYVCECYVDENQKFVGPFKCYHIETNALLKSYFFKQDLLHGEIKEYHLNGKLKLLAEYNYGEAINEWKEFDEEGSLILHRTYKQESKIVRDYFVQQNPYDQLVNSFSADEEPAIYTSECIVLKVPNQRYQCSEAALKAYFDKPPLPPQYLSNPSLQGNEYLSIVSYKINNLGIVDEAKILVSCSDAFLDELALAHVLNMVPFEAAKSYGIPIEVWKEAQIPFKF